MLDIGFSELLLIAVVALIVVGPKDLPVVLRTGAKYLRELREFYSALKTQMHQVMDEIGIDDLKRDVTTIIDMEGKPQAAYNVSDLQTMSATPVVVVEAVAEPVVAPMEEAEPVKKKPAPRKPAAPRKPKPSAKKASGA